MHSLEPEIQTLQRERGVDDAAAARAMALESGRLFSVHQELRWSMYVAVLSITTAIGLFLRVNLDRIGPVTIVLGLGAAAAGCYAYALRERHRRVAESLGAQYVLLLGALLISADLGYTDSRFHWLGGDWSRPLLLLGVIHAVTAYLFRAPLVLSLALAALVGWLGIEPHIGNLLMIERPAATGGGRALIGATLIVSWREIHRRFQGPLTLQEVMEHFAAHLGFWGGLAWCSSDSRLGWGLLAVCGFAAATIRCGMTSGREVFVIYGIVYATIALCVIETRLSAAPVLMLLLQLVTVIAAAAALWGVHARSKETVI